MRSEALQWVGRRPTQKGRCRLICAVLPSYRETLHPRGVGGRWKTALQSAQQRVHGHGPTDKPTSIYLCSSLKHPYFCSTQTSPRSSGQVFTHPSVIMFLSVFLDILVDLSNLQEENPWFRSSERDSLSPWVAVVAGKLWWKLGGPCAPTPRHNLSPTRSS